MSILSGGVPAAGGSGASAMVLLRLYATTVTQQPQFASYDEPGLSQLNAHLATAKTNANDWLNTYNAALEAALQDLVSFGTTFDNSYDLLSAAAKGMASQKAFNPNQISNLMQGLQALQGLVQTNYATAQAAYGQLSSYSASVTADRTAFLSDYNAASAALSGIGPAVAALQAKVASEQAALQKDNAMGIGGGVMSLAGMLLVAIGALFEFETAGASTVLVVGGLAILAGGVAVGTVGGDDADSAVAALQSAQQALAAEQVELTALIHLKGQIDTLTDTLGDAASALSGLVTGWQELDTSLNALIQDLQRPDNYLANLQKSDPSAGPSDVATTMAIDLSVAQTEWKSAVVLVDNYVTKASNVQTLQLGASLPTSKNILAAATAAGISTAPPHASLSA